MKHLRGYMQELGKKYRRCIQDDDVIDPCGSIQGEEIFILLLPRAHYDSPGGVNSQRLEEFYILPQYADITYHIKLLHVGTRRNLGSPIIVISGAPYGR